MAKAPAIGISLGVTHASVAIYRHGAVEMIPIDNENVTMPCVVAFPRSSPCLVGDAAKYYMENGEYNYRNTVYDIGKMLGQQYQDVQEEIKGWLFDVRSDYGRIKVMVPNTNVKLTPEVLCAKILGKLRESAEDYLGLKKVKDAVICVPAYFNDKQRHSIISAGKEADLNILKVIDQTIAIDRVYHVREKAMGDVAVVNVGGATTCISLINNNNGVYRLKKTVAKKVGGHNFDEQLLQFCSKDFKETYKLDLSDSDQAVLRLRSACKEGKHSLTKDVAGYIIVDSLYDFINYSEIIHRETFQELCSGHIEIIIKFVQDTLRAEKFDNSSRLNTAYVIGGSTKVINLRKSLQDVLQHVPPVDPQSEDLSCADSDLQMMREDVLQPVPPKIIDPQYVEVYGAAIEAVHLSGGIFCSVVGNQTRASIAIKIQDLEQEILIPQGEKLPVTRKWSPSDSLQDGITFKLFDGEKELKEYHLDKDSKGIIIRIDRYGFVDVAL